MLTLPRRPEHLLVATALVATCALFLPAAGDPVNPIKLVAVALAAIATVAVVASRAVVERRLRLPWGPVAAVAVVLLLGFVASTVVAPHTSTAVLGTTGRNSGLIAYASAIALVLVVLSAFEQATVRVVAWGLVVSGGFTASYGLLQEVGVDAIRWNNEFDPLIAAMGNPDFSSGYLGICVPVAVWGALASHARWLRLVSAVTAVGCLAGAVLAGAVQGPIAAGAGLVVLAFGALLDAPAPWRARGRVVLGTVVVLGAGTLAAGIAGAGPLAKEFTGLSFDSRTWYMSAAVTMWERNPLLGIGLDSYGLYWPRDRPIESPQQLGGGSFSDSAHSVPLQYLAQGGLLLSLAYLALLGLVVWSVVRGWRALAGQERLLLSGLAGSWTAYQVQSGVSIDQVPLITAGYLLSAAVVVASGTRTHKVVVLPGGVPLAPPPPPAGKKGRQRQPVRVRTTSGGDVAAVGGIALAALVVAWFALYPLRASIAYRDAREATSRGDGDAALAAYDKATGLLPGVGQYWQQRGALLNAPGLEKRALEAFEEAAEHQPYDPPTYRNIGRLAEATGDRVKAERAFRKALELDPDNSGTILDLCIFLLKGKGAAEARTILESAVTRLPRVADLHAWLGDARQVTGDLPGARAAYQQALAVDPTLAKAKDALAKLDGPSATR